VHDDLGWKNQTTRYILPCHWLYEWFSQFHSCGTYSVLSRSPSNNLTSVSLALLISSSQCSSGNVPEYCIGSTILYWSCVESSVVVLKESPCIEDLRWLFCKSLSMPSSSDPHSSFLSLYLATKSQKSLTPVHSPVHYHDVSKNPHNAMMHCHSSLS